MKLGISYNFFNGEEHLIPSLKTVRPYAQFINVVFQRLSNAGNPATVDAERAIQRAYREGLVDQVFEYKPNLGEARKTNERRKRLIGLRLCRRAGCNYFLGMDADEFYRAAHLEYAIELIEREGYTLTTVPSYFHVRRPIYRCFDKTNVAFICRLNVVTTVGARKYPVPDADSTRKVWTLPKRHYFFKPNECSMFHMNLVRVSLADKLKNSSTIDGKFLDDVYQAMSAWSYPNPAFPRCSRVFRRCAP